MVYIIAVILRIGGPRTGRGEVGCVVQYVIVLCIVKKTRLSPDLWLLSVAKLSPSAECDV